MATPEKKSRVSENSELKPRCSNFSKKEVERLEALILKYHDILFTKKIDHATLKLKESVWNNIEEEFNANGAGCRTARQLKNKFDNIKRDSKREEDRKKRRENKTGESPDHDTSEWMESSSNIDNEGYDDDGFMPKDPEITQFIKCEISNGDNENMETEIDSLANMDDNSCSSKSDEPLQKNASTSALEKTIVKTVKRMFKAKEKEISPLQLKKMKVLDELHSQELNKIRESIKQQEQLHTQLIKHNEEKHHLEMIKLNLEIEVLTLKKMEILKNTSVNFYIVFYLQFKECANNLMSFFFFQICNLNYFRAWCIISLHLFNFKIFFNYYCL